MWRDNGKWSGGRQGTLGTTGGSGGETEANRHRNCAKHIYLSFQNRPLGSLMLGGFEVETMSNKEAGKSIQYPLSWSLASWWCWDWTQEHEP